jgi:hypothetical protein
MPGVADHDAARRFLQEGEPPELFEWLDETGATIGGAFPAGGMVRLRKRTKNGYVGCRIAVEDLLDLQDVLPREVWEC